MTGKENQLKKENQQLRNEIEDLKKQLDKLTEKIGHQREEINHDAGIEHGGDTVGKERSVEFVSAQCNDFEAFKKYALKELKHLSSRLNVISDACDRSSQLMASKCTATNLTSKLSVYRCWQRKRRPSRQLTCVFNYFIRWE